VFWLDIKYAEDHKYFMWIKKTFPDPVEMTKDIEVVEWKVCFVCSPFHFTLLCSHIYTPDSIIADRLPSIQMRFRIASPH